MTAPLQFYDRYYKLNSEKVSAYPRLVSELLNILKENVPTIDIGAIKQPEIIVGSIKSLIEGLYSRSEEFLQLFEDPIDEEEPLRYEHYMWYTIFSRLQDQKYEMTETMKYFVNELVKLQKRNIKLKTKICQLEPRINKLRSVLAESGVGDEFIGEKGSPKVGQLPTRFNEAEWMARLEFEKQMNEQYGGMVDDLKIDIDRIKTSVVVMNERRKKFEDTSYLEELNFMVQPAEIIESSIKDAIQSGNVSTNEMSNEVCEQIINTFEELLNDFKEERKQVLAEIEQENEMINNEMLQKDSDLSKSFDDESVGEAQISGDATSQQFAMDQSREQEVLPQEGLDDTLSSRYAAGLNETQYLQDMSPRVSIGRDKARELDDGVTSTRFNDPNYFASRRDQTLGKTSALLPDLSEAKPRTTSILPPLFTNDRKRGEEQATILPSGPTIDLNKRINLEDILSESKPRYMDPDYFANRRERRLNLDLPGITLTRTQRSGNLPPLSGMGLNADEKQSNILPSEPATSATGAHRTNIFSASSRDPNLIGDKRDETKDKSNLFVPGYMDPNYFAARRARRLNLDVPDFTLTGTQRSGNLPPISGMGLNAAEKQSNILPSEPASSATGAHRTNILPASSRDPNLIGDNRDLSKSPRSSAFDANETKDKSNLFVPRYMDPNYFAARKARRLNLDVPDFTLTGTQRSGNLPPLSGMGLNVAEEQSTIQPSEPALGTREITDFTETLLSLPETDLNQVQHMDTSPRHSQNRDLSGVQNIGNVSTPLQDPNLSRVLGFRSGSYGFDPNESFGSVLDFQLPPPSFNFSGIDRLLEEGQNTSYSPENAALYRRPSDYNRTAAVDLTPDSNKQSDSWNADTPSNSGEFIDDNLY